MAIEIEIPKDITKYESKLIGPLTTRQTICSVPAAGLAIAEAMLLKETLSQDMLIGIIIFTVIPFILLGWIKVYNLPFEKFLASVFVTIVLAPKHRKYITDNPIVYEEDISDALDESDGKQKPKAKSNNNNNNNNKKNNNKKKSVPSKTYKAYD